MARKVKDKTLDTKEVRRKLPPRGKAYWRTIERGLHLGYRRLKGKAGTWWARHYIGEQQYEVEPLGIADDLSDADGVAILDYWQAQTKARERMGARVTAGRHGPLTVAKAMDDYLAYLDAEKKSGADARHRDRALIRPVLGNIQVSELRTDDIRKWHRNLAKTGKRLHTRPGEPQQYGALDTEDEDAMRPRKVSANRTLAILRAALNMAFHDKKVASNTEWARVKPFKGVNVARKRYLQVDEAQRLINACNGDFRLLVQAALITGARYGELARLKVEDFKRDSGTLEIKTSKSGKARDIFLTEEGTAFFEQVCAGRPGNAPMLHRGCGQPWGRSHQFLPMIAACKRAKIVPPISFHILRHTWASHAIKSREVSLQVAAHALGHRDTRMVEEHYGHLAPSHIADAIRKGAPRFGFKPDKKVARIR